MSTNGNGNGASVSATQFSDLISAPTESHTFKARQINQLFTPVQKEEFENSAIDPDVLNLNVSILDTSWVARNLHGMEKENDDILTLADVLGMKLIYNQNGRISGAQLSRLQRMKGGWHTLPYYGLADREVVTDLRFKPTVALPDEKGKPRKYLGAIGGETRAYLPNIPDKLWLEMAESFGVEKSEKCYGEWLLANPTIPILHDEGEKKALASTSVGYPSIGLAGYNMGCRTLHNEDGSQRTYQLIPDIAAIAPGRVHYIAWDRDTKSSTVQAVIKERKKYAQLLYEAGAERVLSIQWDSTKYKGIDDFIVGAGAEGLKAAIEAAYEIPKPAEKQDKEKQKSIPEPQEMADGLVSTVFKNVRYDDQEDQWWRYLDTGIWIRTSLAKIRAEAQKYLIEVIGSTRSSYIRECVDLSIKDLLIEGWKEEPTSNFLPFKNGVLDIQKRVLLPHSPDYYFVWQLPRNYAITEGNWSMIDSFLDFLSGNSLPLKHILYAFCALLLMGRATSKDLQKFLFFSGIGGNGKGAFFQLLIQLIGSENTCTMTMARLCDSPFSEARMRGKRLVIFADETKRASDIGKFMSLTGGDPLSCEKKGKDAVDFIYQGLVVMASNPTNLIFSGHNNAALKRRKIDFPCTSQVPDGQARHLTDDFEREVGAFTTYLLNIDPDWVKRTLRDADKNEAVQARSSELLQQENYIAAFIDDAIVFEPEKSLLSAALYDEYADYCRAAGANPKSRNAFTSEFVEISSHTLRHSFVKPARGAGGVRILTGVRLVSSSSTTKDNAAYSLKPHLRNSDSSSNSNKCTSDTLAISDAPSDTLVTHSNSCPDLIGTQVTQLSDHLDKVLNNKEGGEIFQECSSSVNIPPPHVKSENLPTRIGGQCVTCVTNIPESNASKGLECDALSDALSDAPDRVRHSNQKLEIGDRIRVAGSEVEGEISLWHKSKRSVILILADGSLSDWIEAALLRKI